MNMFEQTGEFTPDSLIAGNEFPILKEGIGLKAGQGILKRGSLIVKGSDKAGYIAGTVVKVKTGEGESATETDMKMTIFGILTDDTNTGSDETADNIPAVCYQTGLFNRAAVIVAKDATIDEYTDEMRALSMFLRNVQKY